MGEYPLGILQRPDVEEGVFTIIILAFNWTASRKSSVCRLSSSKACCNCCTLMIEKDRTIAGSLFLAHLRFEPLFNRPTN